MAIRLRNEYLVCYDIEDTRNRTKLFKELVKLGLRSVQKSVFWGLLTGAEHGSVVRLLDKSTLLSGKCSDPGSALQPTLLDCHLDHNVSTTPFSRFAA